MRSSRSIVKVAVAAAALLVFVACNQDFTVQVDDSGFTPARTNLTDTSDAIQWQNTGTSNHTATSSGDGAFFDTGQITPASTSSYIDFNYAGTFRYHDTDHPKATGTVVAPLCVTSDASKGDTISVTWAGCDESSPVTIPAGFHADVEIRRPHQRHWAPWMMNQTDTETSSTLTADRLGRYRFRARYVKDHVVRSGWTPVATCKVT